MRSGIAFPNYLRGQTSLLDQACRVLLSVRVPRGREGRSSLTSLQGLLSFVKHGPPQRASHVNAHHETPTKDSVLATVIVSRIKGMRTAKLQTVIVASSEPADPDERRAPGAPFANRGSQRCRHVDLPGKAEQSPAQVQTFNPSTTCHHTQTCSNLFAVPLSASHTGSLKASPRCSMAQHMRAFLAAMATMARQYPRRC